jgi:hypothetical protein
MNVDVHGCNAVRNSNGVPSNSASVRDARTLELIGRQQ